MEITLPGEWDSEDTREKQAQGALGGSYQEASDVGEAEQAGNKQEGANWQKKHAFGEGH